MDELTRAFVTTTLIWMGFGVGYYFGSSKMKHKTFYVVMFFVITSYQVWRLLL